MPATIVVPRAAATLPTSSAKGPSSGSANGATDGAGLPEVTRERLREDHEVRIVGTQLRELGPVVGRVQGRGCLDQRDVHSPTLPRGWNTAHRAQPPVRNRIHGGVSAAFSAVVLAGGTAARMGGADKAGIELGGRTLLEHALDAVVDAVEVVVVGDPVPTDLPATFVREDPPYGGPAAAC